MKAPEKETQAPQITRRLWLGVPAVGIVALFAGATRSVSAQQAQKASLLAKSVKQIPEDPQDEQWRNADSLDVPLAPQAVVKPRVFEAAIKMVTARALYDEERIAIQLTWRDQNRNARIGNPDTFRDAVAIEFPGDPAHGIPYFAMGEPEKPVVIYQWKADWQFAAEGDEDGANPQMIADWYPFSGRPAGEIATATDYAKTGDRAFVTSWHVGNSLGDRDLQSRVPVEKLQAEGFGTLMTLPADRQDGKGKAVWKDGTWSLVLIVPRAQDRFAFAPGMTVPVAFAAWDGAKRERGGEKAVSTWYFMSLEKPIGTLAYVSPVLAFLGVAAVQAWGMRWLRRRAAQGGGREA
jgi:hypothetical protein